MDDIEDDIFLSDDDESIDDIIDEDWLKNFEFVESNYDKFYNKDNESIKIQCFYYKDSKIHRIIKEKVDLTKKNELSEEELLKIVKNKSFEKYKLMSILRYNIDIKPNEIVELKNKISKDEPFQYLQRIKTVETVYFSPSVEMFSDLNTLYLFFEEKSAIKNHMTKKIKYNIKNRKNKRTHKSSIFKL
jgi:hypothetical protein